MSITITIRPLTESSWGLFEDVFADSNGCDGCWCLNHHLEPGTEDIRGDAARRGKLTLTATGRARGLIALLDDRPVGWCAVDRGSDIPGHDCTPTTDEAAGGPVWAIHCFFIRPEARGKGVARALLTSAVDYAREQGARQIEGYPTPPGRPPSFGGYAGPFSVFAGQGFRHVEDINDDYCRVVLTYGPPPRD